MTGHHRATLCMHQLSFSLQQQHSTVLGHHTEVATGIQHTFPLPTRTRPVLGAASSLSRAFLPPAVDCFDCGEPNNQSLSSPPGDADPTAFRLRPPCPWFVFAPFASSALLCGLALLLLAEADAPVGVLPRGNNSASVISMISMQQLPAQKKNHGHGMG